MKITRYRSSEFKNVSVDTGVTNIIMQAKPEDMTDEMRKGFADEGWEVMLCYQQNDGSNIFVPTQFIISIEEE